MRTAVVLFNLGGPDSPEAVQPFLFNLFNDPAIIRLPGVLRWPLGQLISRRRAPVAQEIYAELGGRSPIRELTDLQAKALEVDLNGSQEGTFKCFVAMRYWHPRAKQVVTEVKEFEPDRIVLLPLYPQFSTTTTLSSLREWRQEAASQQLNVPSVSVCCYPGHAGFLTSHTRVLAQSLDQVPELERTRVLFSAHGLPKRVVDAGDPYQSQVEYTSEKIVDALAIDGLDWKVCYQSRVGPLEWIGPSTEDCIQEAGNEGVGLVVVPVAFVSEHSETLVELDIEYKKLADDVGVPWYVRAPALGTQEDFIGALSAAARTALTSNMELGPSAGFSGCADVHFACPFRSGRVA